MLQKIFNREAVRSQWEKREKEIREAL